MAEKDDHFVHSHYNALLSLFSESIYLSSISRCLLFHVLLFGAVSYYGAASMDGMDESISMKGPGY
jgi:hypothetical protein